MLKIIYKDEQCEIVLGETDKMKNGKWLQSFILRERKEGKHIFWSVIHEDLGVATQEGLEIGKKLGRW